MNILINHRFIDIKEVGVRLGRLVCIGREAGAGENCARNRDPSQGRIFPPSSPLESCKTQVLWEGFQKSLVRTVWFFGVCPFFL